MFDHLIFVAFNMRVAALNRDTGQTLWQWKCPKGSGYVACLLDGDRLVVSVGGYTYCLNPATGEQWWFNELPGMGTGVPSLASARGTTVNLLGAASSQEAENAASTSATAIT
ncbi:MAG TPA: PQQ-binding-like beta-propeller repeat protein [Phycisphaerae bacterium]|jgi:outer membrane protein assembly factor BamB